MIEDSFHSSREERLSRASAEVREAYEKRKKGNFLKKNPQLKILIFDLFIVLVFAAFIVPFFMKLTKDVRVDDYKIESKAFIFEENVLVTLKIIRLNKKIKKRVTTDSLKVAIISDDEISLREKDIQLPKQGEDAKFISFKLDDDKKIEIINIKLLSGNYNKTYKIDIER